MTFFKQFKQKNPDLFTYLKADEVHAHDKFLNLIMLRFFPEWITPNRMSLFRIFATPVVFCFILRGYYQTGVILFLLVAFTDALDGSMARTQNKITKFGMLLDPLADKLLIGSMVIILVFQHFHYLLGVAILGIEIAFIAGAAIAKVKFKTVRMANSWGKIKMITQVIAVFLTLMALLLDFPIFMSLAGGLFGLAIGFAILSLFQKGV